MTAFLVECAPPRASAASNDRLVGSLFAFVVEPGDRYFLAGLPSLEAEMQERVARHRRSPLRGKDCLTAVGHSDVTDEMRRYDFALRVLAQAGFHLVGHQHFHLNL